MQAVEIQQTDRSSIKNRGNLSACADYTYGNDYDEAGKMMYGKGVSQYYHWDKRDYTYEYPPGNFPLPPSEVCRLCSNLIQTLLWMWM